MSARPAQIGQYTIDSELGRGGMGVVYLATDPRLSRKVAIKALHPELTADPERRARLAREARVLASLNHPNIAALFAVEEADDAAFLIIEYVDGPTLAGLFARGRPPLADAVRWCVQIALGVAAAHDAGVLHRDLKPANIKVRPDGIVKVLDFGLATAPPRTGTGVHSSVPTGSTIGFNTRPGGVLGTPGYMPPEQARGLELDRRADVFAFGCILFECLVGRGAFAGGNAADLLAAVIRDEPAWDALPIGVPPSVRALLERCLAKDREDRLRDLADAAVVLRRSIEPASTPGTGASHAAVAVEPPAPCVLPRELTSFVGREAEVEQVRGLLAGAPLLTLTGAGGCGKTRLAIRAARELRQQFAAGVWFVDLSAVESPDLVAAAAVRAMNIPASENADKSPEERVAARIGDRPALLVIDNAEHVLPGVRALVTAVIERCPAARVLATSREPLGLPYEQTYRVPSLAVPRAGAPADEAAQSESGRLFIERARLADPSFRLAPGDGPVLADLCTRLDGIALAIELAAARTATMSLRDIDARLGEALRVLGPPTGGPGTRHATIRAAIEWSVRLLAPEESSVLEQLAVFAGGWNLAAAEAVCRIEQPGQATDAVLARLVSRSLVQFHAATGRYRFLETVRQYTQDRFVSRADAQHVRDRHAEHFLSSVEQTAGATPGSSSTSMVAIDDDVENIKAALRFLAGTDTADDRLARLVYAMQKWWYAHGQFDESGEWTKLAIKRRGGRCEPFDAKLAAGAGSMEWGRGRFEIALEYFLKSLAVWEATGEAKYAAAMLSNIAIASQRLGRTEEAETYHGRALAAYAGAEDSHGLAFAQLNLASFRLSRGRVEECEQLLQQCLPTLERLGDHQRVGVARHNLGEALARRGLPEEAIRHLRTSIDCKRMVGDRRGEANSAIWVGLCLHALGQSMEAASELGRSTRDYLALGGRLDTEYSARLDQVRRELREKLGDGVLQSVWSE